MSLNHERYEMYDVIKRIIDVLFSLTLLIILAPLLTIISICVKLQGDGPIIFKQKRVGLNGGIFEILKFRSMKTTAPNIAAKDIDESSYVTPIGKFLRRTSLDELPQLINILRGEMSFVGPRPLIPNEGSINEKRREYGIHVLRPGLSGWAQINARNTEDQEEKLNLDLYYKENRSVVLDIKIIVMTAFTMFHNK